MSYMRETVLRYEGPPRRNESHLLAEKQQKQNEVDRALTQYIRGLDEDRRAMQRSNYFEACDLKLAKKGFENIIKQCETDAKQGGKSALMVRRRALEVQMKSEMAQNNRELAFVGKAFHQEWI